MFRGSGAAHGYGNHRSPWNDRVDMCDPCDIEIERLHGQIQELEMLHQDLSGEETKSKPMATVTKRSIILPD